MAFKSYLTINGRIHGEVTNGIATSYATDALGSVTATVDNSGNVANTYRYKPYGATLAKTGISVDPKMRWQGSSGYETTGYALPDIYISLLHYSSRNGIYLTSGLGIHSTRSLPGLLRSATTNSLSRSANDIIIGDPFEGRTCDSPEVGRRPGYTNCNFNKGKIYTIICIKDECLQAGTAIHEFVHHKQLSDCCVKASKCYQKYSKSVILRSQKCDGPWQVWKEANEAIWECEAYRTSMIYFDYLDAWCSTFGCLSINEDKCCDKYKEAAAADRTAYKEYCRAAKRAKLKPCPFDENGEPVKGRTI